ncbi:MAG: hypothetical protein U9Q97_03305, partial [Acidobacteriota bacterium]|nr:hypothetical protein [Acidobacteriota bacterium]
MSIFDKIWGRKEEKKYRLLLTDVFSPLVDKIDSLDQEEARDFFEVILDAAERSLRGVLFMAPDEFSFKRLITKEEIEFWLRKVSLVLMSYSYYSYDNTPEAEKNRDLAKLVDTSYRVYWERMFDYYNQIFNENIGHEDVDYYASGLKEDGEKGFSESGNMEKVIESSMKDYKAISSELLKEIWKEEIDSNEKKGLFLGVRIWQAHQQIVQPFLVKLLDKDLPKQIVKDSKRDQLKMKKSVLVVDDDYNMVSILKEYLEADFDDEALEILTAFDSDEAIDIINRRKGNIDLISTDLNRPGMN